MERYLLFDSDCGKCSRIARSIEPETMGWLSVRSLHNREMQMLLNLARPNWKWQPTLLEAGNRSPRVFTGIPMLIRILFGVGLFRAFRIASQLRREGVLSNVLFAPW